MRTGPSLEKEQLGKGLEAIRKGLEAFAVTPPGSTK